MIDPQAGAARPGIYLYCLARPECLAAVRQLTEESLCGVDERYPVTALAEAEIVAVIGDVDTGDFHDENLHSLSWVGPRALRHEAVVERVMTASPVLPVKFGTLFHSRASLEGFLGGHRERIAAVLDDLRDKTEWSVKGYLIEDDFRRSMTASDPTIRSRVAALSPSPGVRYLQQKQLDSTIETQLRAWLTRVTRALHQALLLQALASVELRCHPQVLTGRSGRMVFNHTFLLSPETLRGFRAALSDQQRTYRGSGLTLELQGPWPPYNFCPALC